MRVQTRLQTQVDRDAPRQRHLAIGRAALGRRVKGHVVQDGVHVVHVVPLRRLVQLRKHVPLLVLRHGLALRLHHASPCWRAARRRRRRRGRGRGRLRRWRLLHWPRHVRFFVGRHRVERRPGRGGHHRLLHPRRQLPSLPRRCRRRGRLAPALVGGGRSRGRRRGRDSRRGRGAAGASRLRRPRLRGWLPRWGRAPALAAGGGGGEGRGRRACGCDSGGRRHGPPAIRRLRASGHGQAREPKEPSGCHR